MVELPLLGVLGDLVVAPLDEPEPIEPDEDEPEPIEPDELPPVEPEVLPDEPDELLLPPLEPEEPDLLKCASHSAREIWPSLFVSTDEKLGELELDEPLGELADELDEPPAALEGDELDELPDAPVDGELDEADGVEDDELPDLSESAATASVDSAKSTAAEVILTVLSI